jgi:hypothetical protein
MTHGSCVIGRDNSANSGFIERAFDGQVLTMLGETTIERRERHASLYGDGHVAVAMRDEAIELCGSDDQVDAIGEASPAELGATASQHSGLSRA